MAATKAERQDSAATKLMPRLRTAYCLSDNEDCARFHLLYVLWRQNAIQ